MVPKKILVCTDFSDNSAPAAQLAAEYAKAFGAELIIVHVVDAALFPTYVDWVGDEIDRVLSRTKESAEARLAEISAEYGKKGFTNVKTLCTMGAVAGEIVSLAETESADLVVVGTHGRSGVKHLVMGSVARNVLRTAHRPVLIVEAPSS
jgi:universal stress protein A